MYVNKSWLEITQNLGTGYIQINVEYWEYIIYTSPEFKLVVFGFMRSCPTVLYNPNAFNILFKLIFVSNIIW